MALLRRWITIGCRGCRQQSNRLVFVDNENDPMPPEQMVCANEMHHAQGGAGAPMNDTVVISVEHKEDRSLQVYLLAQAAELPDSLKPHPAYQPGWREEQERINAEFEAERQASLGTPEEQAARQQSFDRFMRQKYGFVFEQAQ